MTRILLALVVLATLATEASAQSTTRSFYNSIGQSIGRATTSGNTTTFRDSVGRNSTSCADDERKHDGDLYDASGKLISRETTTGNTTTVYDASGRNVGRFTSNR